jgi:hypothetical protein
MKLDWKEDTSSWPTFSSVDMAAIVPRTHFSAARSSAERGVDFWLADVPATSVTASTTVENLSMGSIISASVRPRSNL